MNYKTLITILTLSLSVPSLATGYKGDEEKEPSQTLNHDITYPGLSINSSSYTTAIGIRGFGTSGLTIKHFTSNSSAYEGIVGFWPNAFSATFLFEQYVNAFGEPGLNWYYGIGGHVATKSNWAYVDGVMRSYRINDGGFGVGVDGIFGLEYKIREIPVAVSMDVKPFVEITNKGNAYLAMDPGLGIKVTF